MVPEGAVNVPLDRVNPPIDIAAGAAKVPPETVKEPFMVKLVFVPTKRVPLIVTLPGIVGWLAESVAVQPLPKVKV